jgi:hypothetical protein
MVLANSYEQAVHVVVDLGKRRAPGSAHGGGSVRSRLKISSRLPVPGSQLGCDGGQRAFAERADFVISGGGRQDLMAVEDAAGVGIDHEDGMLAGVEKDGVSGFRADAVEGE